MVTIKDTGVRTTPATSTGRPVDVAIAAPRGSGAHLHTSFGLPIAQRGERTHQVACRLARIAVAAGQRLECGLGAIATLGGEATVVARQDRDQIRDALRDRLAVA